MSGDTPEGGDNNHDKKGDQDHHVDHQLPVAKSPDEGSETDDDFGPNFENRDPDDLDDDEAFESMIKVIRVVQCGGLSASRGQNLQPDDYTTPAPHIMFNEDKEARINPHSIPKHVTRQTFSQANNNQSSGDDEDRWDTWDFKQRVLVSWLLPRKIFTMETQAVGTMVLLDMYWYPVGDYKFKLEEPIEETCLAILFVFDKIGMQTTAKEDLPLGKKATEGIVKRAYIDVVKNWLFKYNIFEVIAKTDRIADDIARWKKHRPMLFDDPNNVLEGWEP